MGTAFILACITRVTVYCGGEWIVTFEDTSAYGIKAILDYFGIPTTLMYAKNSDEMWMIDKHLQKLWQGRRGK